MIRIEFLLIYVGRNQVWGKYFSWGIVCHRHGKEKKKKIRGKRKNEEKSVKSMKKKTVWKKKKKKKSSKVLFVEVRVQNNEFGPKELFKSSPCVLKLISAI